MLLSDFSIIAFLLLVTCASSKKAFKQNFEYRDRGSTHYLKRGIFESGRPKDSYEKESGPPKPVDAAKMARYIVHNSDWASVATISALSKVKGFPFANVYSISDGLVSNSSGIPYMYMTKLDRSAQDLELDSRCSLTMTLAQGEYCRQQGLDPEDPRCARVTLTGEIIQIQNGSSEADYARNALFSRHPEMRPWPVDHHWYFAKLKIDQIFLMDYFGGPKFVELQDYFGTLPEKTDKFRIEVVYV